MKDKIIAKLDEHIRQILDKPEITGEEYMTLRYRLEEILMEEEKARQSLQADQSYKRMMDMIRSVLVNAEVEKDGM